MSEAEIGVEIYLWKKDMEIIYDAKNNDQANMRRAYRVNIENFTEALRSKLEA